MNVIEELRDRLNKTVSESEKINAVKLEEEVEMTPSELSNFISEMAEKYQVSENEARRIYTKVGSKEAFEVVMEEKEISSTKTRVEYPVARKSPEVTQEDQIFESEADKMTEVVFRTLNG